MQRMSEMNMPTWVEDPTPALVNVKQFSRKGEASTWTKKGKRSREAQRGGKEVLAKVPQEQRRLVRAIHGPGPEKRGLQRRARPLFDLYTHAMMRRSALGLGRRFAQEGALDQPEDIFFLIPDEVRRAGYKSRPVRSALHRRPQESANGRNGKKPPILRPFLEEGFDLDMAMGVLVQSMDPIALKVVVGAMPQVRPELKADLYGTCGSPGVCEGTGQGDFNRR